MSNVGETAVDYSLCEELEEAYKAGVFDDMGVPGENEDRHVSLLEYLMIPLDDKETYVVTKTLVTHHWDTFKKTLEYLERKEGEQA